MRVNALLPALLAFFTASCGPTIVSVEELPKWSLEITDISSQRTIKVRLRDGVGIREAMPLDLFEGFWPAITHDEAAEKFGEPLFVRRIGHGVFYYYLTSVSAVEVARERVASWGHATVWNLTAFPKDPDPGPILADSISKHLGESGFVEVRVLNSSGRPNTAIYIRDRQVLYATWINAGEVESGPQ